MSTKVLSAIILALAIVLGSVAASYVFVIDKPHQAAASSSLIVEDGDSVSVDYIGLFQDGTVFDTSIDSVARNDAVYPKALSFTERFDYPPLNFTVGAGQMIKGFETGVIGMRPNETRTLTVSPENGYGAHDPSKLATWPLRIAVPVFEVVSNSSEFQNNYGVTAIIGTDFVSDHWGWNATVYFVDGNGIVTVKNRPDIGEVVKSGPALWGSKVISVDEAANAGKGVIVLEHQISQADVGKITGTDDTGPYMLHGVDQAAGTYTLDYNKEVVGKTLTFQITMRSITKKAA